MSYSHYIACKFAKKVYDEETRGGRPAEWSTVMKYAWHIIRTATRYGISLEIIEQRSGENVRAVADYFNEQIAQATIRQHLGHVEA